MSTANEIASFAVLDLETTGLPGRDFDKADITEITIHGIAAEYLHNEVNNDIPRIIHKLTLLFKPQLMIHSVAAEITGLTNSMLRNESSFDINAANIIINFLKHLRQPVCLVAHNGNRFDFPVLKYALLKLGMELPSDIMCIDTLVAIKKLDKLAEERGGILSAFTRKRKFNSNQAEEDSSLEIKFPTQVTSNQQAKLYRLESVYFRCFGEAPEGAHHAEADVANLAKVMFYYGKSFVEYSEANAKLFRDIY